MLIKSLHKTLLAIFTILIVSTSLAFALKPLIGTAADDKQRYLCVGLLITSHEPSSTTLIEQAAAAGANAVMLVISWEHVYPTTNSTAQWAEFDRKVKRARELGMKIFIRVNLCRSRSTTVGFWSDAESMIDGANNKLDNNGLSFSFGAQTVVEKANNFVREVAEHYNYVQQAGDLLTIAVTTTPTQEAGYHFQNETVNGTYATLFDYSPLFVDGFRLWLKSKYKDIRRLNELWFTDLGGFDEISGPYNANYLPGAFSFTLGLDWYLYRHQMLKKFMDTVSQTIKNVNPSYKVINDFGSVYDGLSPRRSTLAFKDLGANNDGTKINDESSSPHRFATDLVRSNIGTGKWVMNEMFPEPNVPIAEMFRFEDECFEHGCKLINFVVAEQAQLDYFKPVVAYFKQKWLNNPLEVIKPTATMTVRLSEVLRGEGYDQPGYKAQWAELYAQYKQPIQILLAEDILQRDGNIVPTLDAGIGNQSTVMGFDWKFQIPSDTFQDVDGFISGYEATGLPNGLTFKNNTITGIPTVAGKFQITVKGFDNSNASVATTFTLVVKTASKIDINLYKSGNSQTRQLIKTLKKNDTLYLNILNYAVNFVAVADGSVAAVNLKMVGALTTEKLDSNIPYSLFDDNDGSILKAGQYTITANSYNISTNVGSSNGIGWQELSFTVLDKPKNTAPVVQNIVPNQTAKLNNSFAFSIPSNTFKDAESAISKIIITGLPTGLTASGSNINGKASQKGSFVVVVEGFDAGGLSVKTQFTIVVSSGNEPPYLEYSLANQTVLIDKKFRYDVVGYAFNDRDGTVIKTEVLNLPFGLAYKDGLISGIPTIVGIYDVTAKATDNEGASISATFKITVKDSKPIFEVMLISGGDVYSRRKITILTDGKIISPATLPSLLNIYVSPASIDVDRIDFEMSGTAKNKYSDSDYPYGVYEGETGFSPKIGKYQLKITSYLNGQSNGGQTINFEIKN
jgi:hypothetical protein